MTPVDSDGSVDHRDHVDHLVVSLHDLRLALVQDLPGARRAHTFSLRGKSADPRSPQASYNMQSKNYLSSPVL